MKQIAFRYPVGRTDWLLMGTTRTLHTHPAPGIRTLGTLVRVAQLGTAVVTLRLCFGVVAPIGSPHMTVIAVRADVGVGSSFRDRPVMVRLPVCFGGCQTTTLAALLPELFVDRLEGRGGLPGARQRMVTAFAQGFVLRHDMPQPSSRNLSWTSNVARHSTPAATTRQETGASAAPSGKVRGINPIRSTVESRSPPAAAHRSAILHCSDSCFREYARSLMKPCPMLVRIHGGR